MEWMTYEKNRLTNQWNEARQKEAEYRAYASEMQKVYDDMKNIKGDMEAVKKNMKNFFDRVYEDFKGEHFNKYENVCEVAMAEYTGAIKRIDDNLDRLNNEITKYENFALETYGIMGTLAKQINNIANMIENCLN